jgi:hypothetical protein
MSIRRYVANKDTTITNAFKENLTTRATTANMGASDILEVFSIYGQATTSSLEASRVLVEFPINDIISDRNNKKIAASGSVQFILKLSNAPHGNSTPSNFTLLVSPISRSWIEGTGLDMETYTDVGPVNWLSSSDIQSWTTEGGDFLPKTYTQYFDTGLEDLEIDITETIENWIVSSSNNFGFGIRLTGSEENSTESYYTKRFFARGSEFFFKRPWIEARTNDSFKDDRNKFTISSSLLDSQDNLNTLVVYNRVNGQLKNIPSIGTGSGLNVSLYAGVFKPSGSALVLHNNQTKIEAGFYKTGVYTASVGINTKFPYLFDVWFSGNSAEATDAVVFATGSVIYTNDFEASFDDQQPQYVISVANLKSSYKRNEQTRIKIVTRDKDWSPNIYHVSSYDVENIVIDNLFYKVIRIQDGLEVVPYGTGAIEYTKLSYDKDGNYFDLNFDLFEPGYLYGIKIGHKYGDGFNEFSETFKFRVE